MPYTLQFSELGVNPDSAIIHDNESFRVQWSALNRGPDTAPKFVDRLQILRRPEGCSGPEEQKETSVFDSEANGERADFEEAALKPRQEGRVLSPLVGPFPEGSYRLTVTLDIGGPNPVTLFNCIDIQKAV